MVVGSFGLILGLGLRLRLRLALEWWLQLVVSGFCRLLGLTPVHADVDGSLRTVPRRRVCPDCGSAAVAIAAGGWRLREKILKLVDQLLLLLLAIAKAVLGAAPAIAEMNHRTNEITDSPATLEAMAALLVAAEAIHQIIAGIYKSPAMAVTISRSP
jgi:hypothetical protein